MTEPTYIFISHSSKDNDFCADLIEKLRAAFKNIGRESTIWFDITHIHPGESWPKQIGEALDQCSIFLLIMSPDAMKSEWANDECSIALALRKPVIPILLRDCKNKIWPMIAHLQPMDFSDTSQSLTSTMLDNLRGEILNKLGEAPQLPFTQRIPQTIQADKPSSQAKLMQQMLAMVRYNSTEQSWNEVVSFTGMVIRFFGSTTPSAFYYHRGIAFAHQNRLQEADEALSLALSVVDDLDLRLRCLRARTEVLIRMRGHQQEVLLLVQDALRLQPRDSYWLSIERRMKTEITEEEEPSRSLTIPPRSPLPTPGPLIPLPTQKPFGIAWLTFEGHQDTVRDLAWSPDSQYLASAGSDRKINIWEIKNVENDDAKRPVFTYNGHKREVNAVEWSPNGSFLASAGRDQTVQIWQINREEPITTWTHKDWVNDIAWSPDGFLLASACNNHKVRIRDTRDQLGKERVFSHNDEVHCLGWSPDGKYIAAGGLNGRIYIWDVSASSHGEEHQVNILKGSGECIYDLVWMPDGNRLAAASADQTVRIWNNVTLPSAREETTSNFTEYKKYDHPVFALTRSQHGRRIASTDGNAIHVWYTTTGSRIFKNPVHNGRVWAIAWAPNDRYVASAGSDRLIQVWSIVEDKDTAS